MLEFNSGFFHWIFSKFFGKRSKSTKPKSIRDSSVSWDQGVSINRSKFTVKINEHGDALSTENLTRAFKQGEELAKKFVEDPKGNRFEYELAMSQWMANLDFVASKLRKQLDAIKSVPEDVKSANIDLFNHFIAAHEHMLEGIENFKSAMVEDKKFNHLLVEKKEQLRNSKPKK